MINLISDPWIPVHRRSGPDIIRPDEIAQGDVERFDWPRPDLNLACHELLIGLIYLACPPEDKDEDDRRSPPDQPALQKALTPLTPAFNLLGEGPRFLQDRDELEGEPNPPDMLFIDSAGASTAKKNADLMVRRDRYKRLSLPLAAMALYTLQAFAPSGGAGNRTSMRGGGPMVTLVKPQGQGLWPLIWANVPYGARLDAKELDVLPWMRPTATSEKGQVVVPDRATDGPQPEMFFGQPRRLRLVAEGDVVTGVIQRPYGANYAQWVHDLSPYYEDARGQKLPLHPKPEPFGYRNWRGVILQTDKRRCPANLENYRKAQGGARVNLIVAGWAMDNMKPLDFLWSEQPVFTLSPEAESAVVAMIEAAEQAGFALATCIRDGAAGESETATGAAKAAQTAFFDRTQRDFVNRVAALSKGRPPDPEGWLTVLRGVALTLFDNHVLPGLFELQESRRAKAVAARKALAGAFSGYSGFAKKIYQALELKLPARPKKKKDVA